MHNPHMTRIFWVDGDGTEQIVRMVEELLLHRLAVLDICLGARGVDPCIHRYDYALGRGAGGYQMAFCDFVDDAHGGVCYEATKECGRECRR